MHKIALILDLTTVLIIENEMLLGSVSKFKNNFVNKLYWKYIRNDTFVSNL